MRTLGWIGTRWLDTYIGASDLRLSIRKGRILARRGAVESLEVGTGWVNARVRNDTGASWGVRVKMSTLPEPVWEAVTSRLAGEAALAAVILRGRIDQRVDALVMNVTDGQTGLFPNDRRDCATHCECQESAEPCSHGMAVHYELAMLFDADPLQLMLLRGRERERLVAAVRGGDEDSSGAATASGDADEDDERFELASRLLDGFWERGVVPHLAFRIDEAEVADEDALPVLRALGPGPGETSPEEVIDVLRPLLRTGRARVRAVLERVGDEGGETMPNPAEAERLDDILVAAAHQHGSLTSGFVAKALGITSREARQYLQWLVEEKRLRQVGRARGTKYIPWVGEGEGDGEGVEAGRL